MPPITPLRYLDRTSPTFKADCDVFFGEELHVFSEEVEAARLEVVAKEVSATAAALGATSAAGTATTQANIATTKAAQTASDAEATADDRIQTGMNRTAAATSAAAAIAAMGTMTPVEAQTAAAALKATPADGDEFSFIDSAASWVLKKFTWANLVAAVRSSILGVANTFTSAQVYSDQQLSRGMLKDMGNVFFDKGNSGTATQTLDYTAGSHQKITVTGAHTIATSNWPPGGNLGEVLLELVNGAAYAITWPTIIWVKSDGTSTTSFSSNGVILQSSGTDWVLLWSRDGGTTIFGKVMR